MTTRQVLQNVAKAAGWALESTGPQNDTFRHGIYRVIVSYRINDSFSHAWLHDTTQAPLHAAELTSGTRSQTEGWLVAL